MKEGIPINTIKSTTDVINLINEMASSGVEALEKHAATLQGPRQRGSTTERGIEEFPDIPLHEQEGASGEAQAYSFECPEMGGEVKAISLFQAKHFELPIMYRESCHGGEFFTNVSKKDWYWIQNQCKREGKVISVIVGPYHCSEGSEWNGKLVVYTWHPGFILDALNVPVNDKTAVKIEVKE